MLEAIAALIMVAMIVLLAWDASNGNVLRWGKIGGVVAFVLLVFWIGLYCAVLGNGA